MHFTDFYDVGLGNHIEKILEFSYSKAVNTIRNINNLKSQYWHEQNIRFKSICILSGKCDSTRNVSSPKICHHDHELYFEYR